MEAEKEALRQKPNIPSKVQQVIDEIESTRDMSIGKLKKLLQNADITTEDIMPWSDFEHPVSDSYGRNLLYNGGFFEIMVMSWNPGDFSAIHDHGYTEWGVVQVFGAAEHAVFFVQDGTVQTLSRNIVKPKQILGVGHEMVHQMGNPGETPYLSLHIYGNPEREGSITAEARLFDVESSEIIRTSGGIFYGLPKERIIRIEKGAEPDFITCLRDRVEAIKRIQTAQANNQYRGIKSLDILIEKFFDPKQYKHFIEDIEEYLDENQQSNHAVYWKLLIWELKEAAQLQNHLLKQEKTGDNFQYFVEVYDEVIGQPALDGFIQNYLSFLAKNYLGNLEGSSMLSIGCGTGLVEEWMLNNLGLKKENVYGIDISTAMISVASKRFHAEIGDALTLDPAIRLWDLTFCGLNVFQYIKHNELEKVIKKTAQVTKPGGYFFGDFITPDHIRNYPNVIKSREKAVTSVQSPKLVEKENHLYQENEVINVQATDDKFRVSYDGTHIRFLPPIHKVRQYFEEAFRGEVLLFDALSLKPILAHEDTCPSTRYIVLAKKK